VNTRRLRRILRDLPMPEPFDARTLCARVAEQRGRPMRLVPMSGLTGVCGLWVATDTTDLLFYESDTTAPHQEHIILHELAHVLCDHYPSGLDTQGLLPSLDPAMVRRVLGRAGYSTKEEREAELLASMIRQHATGGTLGDRLRTSLDGHG
jgi:hypothetical protein